jgi:hypothetical protein
MKTTRQQLAIAAFALLCGAAIVVPGSAPAQTIIRTTPVIQGPGTLVGIVVTPTGTPIDSAIVTIIAPRRETRTGTDGQFRFNRVPDGEFDLVVRKVGFSPQRTRMKVDKDGGSVRITLPPTLRTLPASVTEATISGLGGIVGDTAFKAIAGATVRVIASAAPVVTTDSMGAFYTPLGPGHYAVEVSMKGFVRQIVSVTIPEDGGRRLAVLMTPGTSSTRAREAFYLDQLRERRVYASGPFQKLYTREDINRLNVDDMQQLASAAAVRRVDDGCEVTLDGNPLNRMPIWALDLEDFEFVEVYGSGQPIAPGNRAAAGVTSMNGMSPMRGQGLGSRTTGAGPIGGCPAIIGWTRR